MDIKECLEEGYLKKIVPDGELIKKELNEAKYDFEKAENAFGEKDFKWCIVKSYYAMFHAARAVLFKIGLREKRHFAIGVVLEDLSKQGKLEHKFISDFDATMSSREEADYHYTYSKETAEHSLQISKEFLEGMHKFLKLR